MKIKLLWLLVLATICASFAGCSSGKAETRSVKQMEAKLVVGEKEAPVVAEPEKAAEAVCDKFASSTELAKIEPAALEKITGITSDDAIEAVAYSSEAKKGLANVFIIRPYPSLREDVRDKLLSYRETKIREFENFDILDSYTIAKNAIVYDQGEYLVMLMLSDIESAQSAIDAYIPQ